jgi:5,10-methylenetetrahydromethanopterin reductase
MLAPRGIGISMVTTTPTDEVLRVAREADRCGFHSFWVAEGSHNFRAVGEPRSATSVAAAIAVTTSRLAIGLGIISIYTRHPAVLAQEAQALAELSGGRFVLGVGATKNAMLHMGHTAASLKPVAVHREAIEIVRALLSGRKVEYAGTIFRLDAPARPEGEPELKVPIAMAATGPQMLRLSGAIADVVLLPPFTTPAFVRYAREEIEKGAAAAGRNLDDIVIGAPLPFSVDEDGGRAHDAIRPLVANYISTKAKNADDDKVMQLAGVTSKDLLPIAQAIAAAGVDAGVRMLSDELIDKVALAGTPEECRLRLRAYRDAGMGLPLLYQTLGPDRVAAVRLIAERILPDFADT